MKTKLGAAGIALACLLTLSACQAKPAAEGSMGDAATLAPAAPGGNAKYNPAPSNDKATPGDGGAAENALRVPQLAYDYAYSFAASPDGVEALLKADQAACDRAGVTECQMISLSSDSVRDAAYVHKTLELRATAAWVKTWQSGLDAAVAKANGRIAQQNISSEDLSLQIVDTAAHIQNKEALRDRLQQIIRTSNGKVAELIEAETQLSDVQADIDASKSALAVMQKRVATSHLTLTYESEGAAASRGTFAPVTEAGKNVLGNMMIVVALLINLLSFLVPVALVGIPAVWFGRKWYLARKAKVAKEETHKLEEEK